MPLETGKARASRVGLAEGTEQRQDSPKVDCPRRIQLETHKSQRQETMQFIGRHKSQLPVLSIMVSTYPDYFDHRALSVYNVGVAA